MTRTLQRVPLEVSIHWRYLRQDTGKSCLEIAKIRSYGMYSKAICRHMKKSIGDLAIDKRKENQGRSPKLSVRQKRNIIRHTKILQEEIGIFCVKSIKVRDGIPRSVSDETVCRVLKKAGIK